MEHVTGIVLDGGSRLSSVTLLLPLQLEQVKLSGLTSSVDVPIPANGLNLVNGAIVSVIGVRIGRFQQSYTIAFNIRGDCLASFRFVRVVRLEAYASVGLNSDWCVTGKALRGQNEGRGHGSVGGEEGGGGNGGRGGDRGRERGDRGN